MWDARLEKDGAAYGDAFGMKDEAFNGDYKVPS
jgi:hypothetical protein